MGFFSNIFHNKVFKAIAPIVIGAFNPALGAAVGGALGASNGGGILGGVTGAAGGYFGGSALGGAASGAMGLPVAGTVGPQAGGLSGALSGGSAGLSGAGSALGSALGIGGGTISNASNVLQALSLGGSMMGSPSQIAQSPQAAQQQTQKPFTPKRPEALQSPSSLNDISGFAPDQTRSALATRGVNQGLGQQEQDYYKNLLQRSLIGEGNKVNTSNPNFLMPIESQYFSQQGNNTSDVMKFLQGIS